MFTMLIHNMELLPWIGIIPTDAFQFSKSNRSSRDKVDNNHNKHSIIECSIKTSTCNFFFIGRGFYLDDIYKFFCFSSTAFFPNVHGWWCRFNLPYEYIVVVKVLPRQYIQLTQWLNSPNREGKPSEFESHKKERLLHILLYKRERAGFQRYK